MDAETRKTLDDMASDPGVWHETRAVVQAALADLDALREDLGSERSRVTNLCRLITGRAADNELSNERLGEACREANRLRAQVDALTQQVRDLSGALVTIEERLRLDAAPLVELANADGTPRMRHAWKAVYSSAVHAQCFIVPAVSAAKWHREKAQDERDISEARAAAYPRHAERYAENAAHHATAADALEALAVPGVARIFDLLARGYSVDEADRVPEVRAALATLAKIASEGK